MALSANKNTNEERRFRGTDAGTCVSVCNDDGGSINPSADLIPSGWDFVSNAPTATTDVWTYRDGGSGGTIVGEVTVTYTDATKCDITSVERTA